MSKKKGMIVSGYFNPIHKGHIEYINNAYPNSILLLIINYLNGNNSRIIYLYLFYKNYYA